MTEVAETSKAFQVTTSVVCHTNQCNVPLRAIMLGLKLKAKDDKA